MEACLYCYSCSTIITADTKVFTSKLFRASLAIGDANSSLSLVPHIRVQCRNILRQTVNRAVNSHMTLKHMRFKNTLKSTRSSQKI
jgi:hypothetical protein